MSIYQELKRRNVFRAAAGYVVVAWLILQVIDVVVPILELPNWIAKTTLLILLIGFPAVILLAWAFELTPDGLKPDKDVDHLDPRSRVVGRKLDLLIIVVLTVALVVFALDKFVWTSSRSLAGVEDRRSIAVLPFRSISATSGNEYFADGLSEEIINLLARIPNLKVIGRTSSFAFKDKNEDVRVIGDLLNVGAVLEGSVRIANDRLRISARLIDTSDASEIWTNDYDRVLADVFELQDEVAASIIEALQVHVGVMPSRGTPTENTSAYALFLQARVQINAFQFREAEQTLQDALRIDPNFAEAYELLAYCYWFLGGTIVDSSDGQRIVGEAALRALELDPGLTFAKALDVAANTKPYSFYAEIQAVEQALAVQKDSPWMFGILVFRLMETGYLQEAVAVAERFVEADPLSSVAHNRLSEALYASGQVENARASANIANDLDLGSDSAHWNLAHINLAEGRDEAAIQQFEFFLRQFGYADISWVRELIVGARDPDVGLALLDRRIPEIIASLPPERAFEIEVTLITWYLFFGHLDRMFERIFEFDVTSEAWSDADVPVWQGTMFHRLGFTAHPRYLELARSMGITELWDERGPPDFCDKIDGDWVCE